MYHYFFYYHSWNVSLPFFIIIHGRSVTHFSSFFLEEEYAIHAHIGLSSCVIYIDSNYMHFLLLFFRYI